MGKKNKKNTKMGNNESIETNEANDSSLLKISEKTDKKNSKSNEQPELKTNKKPYMRSDKPDNITENSKNPTQKKKRNKRKLEDNESNIIASTCEKKVKSNERKPSTSDAETKNLNIVFSDDGMSKGDISKKPKAKFLNQDEAEVKDEDIDKFCEEITDEDNKTYENWVEMFEANFKKNKSTK